MKGIDISEFQPIIDYKKVKESGIEFVILRCGYGKNESQKDSKFETHYNGFKNAGIKVGAYLYSYCNNVNNAKLEAENCLKFIKGKSFELPIFYDLEDKTIKPLGKENITKIAKIFCETIENAGYKSGIYANLDWFKNYINVNELLNYKIWLAQWNDKPTANFRIDYWQYSNNGKIEGIKGRIDLDISYINEETKPIIIKKTNEQIVNEIIEGKWGNGEIRKQKLSKAGYNYSIIQDLVNKKLLGKNETLKKGDYVIFKGTKDYNGYKLDDWVYNSKFQVIQVNGDRVVIGRGGIVTAPVNKKYCEKV